MLCDVVITYSNCANLFRNTSHKKKEIWGKRSLLLYKSQAICLIFLPLINFIIHFWCYITIATYHLALKSDLMSCNCHNTFSDICVRNWLNHDEDMMMSLCINMWCHNNSIVMSCITMVTLQSHALWCHEALWWRYNHAFSRRKDQMIAAKHATFTIELPWK